MPDFQGKYTPPTFFPTQSLGPLLPSQPLSGTSGSSVSNPLTFPTGAPSGTFNPGGSSNGSGSNVGGVVGDLAPLLLSLFGNNKYTGQAAGSADSLTQLSKLLTQQGTALTNQGASAIAPVLAYLMKVAGGSSADLLSATTPERNTVLSQYDTARAGFQFLPRGGSQAGALGTLGAKEATSMADIIAGARQKGISDLGALGQNLVSAGGSRESAAGSDLSSAASIYGSLAQQRDAQLGSFGKAIGTAAALAFL